MSYHYCKKMCFGKCVQVELNTENNMLQGTSSTFQFIDVSFIAILRICATDKTLSVLFATFLSVHLASEKIILPKVLICAGRHLYFKLYILF